MRLRVLLTAAFFAVAGAARATETVAVLSSGLSSYQEGYAAFKSTLGSPVELLPLGARLPKDAKVVVAFGGKAALQKYPDAVTLIYAFAPSIEVRADTHDGPTTRIWMMPELPLLLQKLTEVQPGLKRLGVIWSSEGQEPIMERLPAAGHAQGLAIVIVRISGDDELPDALRRLKGRIDALWLPADPLVVNATNFELIKHYSYDNDIPFYAPIEGLAEKGAVATVSVAPAELGRAAAAAARDALGGKAPPAAIFPPLARLAVNLSAARECELSVPPGVVKAADKVFP